MRYVLTYFWSQSVLNNGGTRSMEIARSVRKTGVFRKPRG